MGVIQGYTRSLDHSSHNLSGLGILVLDACLTILSVWEHCALIILLEF